MKFSGVAAIALAAFCGQAAAQGAPAKFDIKIGGDALFEAGYTSQERDGGLRSTEFRNRMRIVVTPSAKADNGLEYGARIRLRAANGDRSVDSDRAFLFANGGFGTIRLGQVNSLNDDIYVSRPWDYAPLALTDVVAQWLAATQAAGSQPTLNGRYAGADVAAAAGASSILQHSMTPQSTATKLVYLTPRFSGAQFGASYTPRSDSFNTDVNRSKYSSTAGSAQSAVFQDMIEAGANYRETFGAVSVRASVGYIWGKTSDSTSAADRFEDFRAWQAGAQIGFAGFIVGGGYIDYGKSGQNKNAAVAPFRDDSNTWNVGVQYQSGPLTVGAAYLYGQDAGSLTARGKRKLDVIEVGLSYAVAPGLQLQAQYDHFKADSDKPSSVVLGDPDDRGNVVLLRSVLAF